MAVTVKDVAEKAEVSVATVSRAFNKKEGISEQTRKKVLKAASELGYKPKIQGGKARNIGIIFSNRFNSIASDPFYGQVMKGVEKGLIDCNYHLYFKTVNMDQENNSNIISTLYKDKNLTGLILVGQEISENMIEKIKEKNIPVVLIDNDLSEKNIDCVVTNNEAGAKKVVNHLLELGYKEIGFFGGPLTHKSLQKRYYGYCQALEEANIKVNRNLNYIVEKETLTVEKAFKMSKKYLENIGNKIKAVFAANDFQAIGLIRAARSLGYDIPDDFSIVGFDDIESARHTVPPLTTIRVFKEEIGVLAGKRLHDLIQKRLTKAIKILVSVELIVRESSKKNK
ncbi:MAG: LacI family DNA-binding transcriptional regulator [Bacillota bacterium]